MRLLGLSRTRNHDSQPFACYDNLGRETRHGAEQRYVSPTTGICRKLVLQAVTPSQTPQVKEVSISNHANDASKRATWLLSNCPLRRWIIFKWIYKLGLFHMLLLWSIVWSFARICFQFADDDWDTGDSEDESYSTGYYKPYSRRFRGQLWAARSSREYSSLSREEEGNGIRTRALYPRNLIIRNGNEWVLCTDHDTIIHTKFIAISYRMTDICTPGGATERTDKARFTDEVRAAVLGQNVDAYWLDLECLGETQSEKNMNVYCMADVYRRAEVTLIMLGRAASGEDESRENECWERYGQRAWTFPEALLSSRLCYKFQDREEVNSLSLFQLANLAYAHSEDEQAIINAYGGKDPLERLERLTLLKQAIWKRGTFNYPTGPPLPPQSDIGGVPISNGAYRAEHVYALMGFFEHRILPNHEEDELKALARLSMANDNDRIIERMLSMLPSTITQRTCWYAENDVYGANLWDILPEIQVSGVTESGALVADGCRAAAIRWKDFPEVACAHKYSLRRRIVGSLPYLAWLVVIIGVAIMRTLSKTTGIVLTSIGAVVIISSPRLFIYSQSGRIIDAQPWLIGVKGVIHSDDVESHLYGGAIKHIPRMFFTPSGSWFSVPERGKLRGGSNKQYADAIQAEESGPYAGQMYTLIDTCSSTMYYFHAEKAPTVCIFTGREGGLGRFVLCSENCQSNELHKESVLRMPTEIIQKMQMCGWVALG